MRVFTLLLFTLFPFGICHSQITTVENYFYNTSTQYGDVNADGKVDEVYYSGDKIHVRTVENGESTSLQSFTVPTLFKNFALANIDDDPFLEMYYIVLDYLYVVENESGKLGQRSTIRGKISNRTYQNVFAADFDGDGDDDPVVHIDKGNIFWMEKLEDGFNSDDVRIVMDYKGVEGGSFGTFCDYDQDGDMDALLYNVYHGVYIVLNPGEGNFSGDGTRMSSVWNPQAYKVHDVDQDGFPDIIQTYRTSNDQKSGSGRIHWNPYGSGKGGGGNLGEFYHPGAIDVEDYDGDGDLDVFVADRESIEVFTNMNETSFERSNLWGNSFHDFPGNYPRSLICDDIDDDGLLEFIYTNYNPTYSKRINSLYTKSGVVETNCQNEDIYGLQCFIEGLTLMTQEEVGIFAEENADCKNVRGDLIIGPQVTDLSALSRIQIVEGDLHLIGNQVLPNLQGLENLRHVGGDVIIESMNLLTDLSALESLASVNGNVVISQNQNLLNLKGLRKLAAVHDRLEISANPLLTSISDLTGLVDADLIHIGRMGIDGGNPNLESLVGLNNLETLYKFEIHQNHKLKNLEGLTQLRRVNGNFVIRDNDSLENFEGMVEFNFVSDTFHIVGNKSLTGFEGLNEMWGVHLLIIEDNDAITNFVGFSSLRFNRSAFNIIGNDNLTSMFGLEGFEEVRISLEISDNPNLISLWGLRNVVKFGSAIKINNNDALTSLAGLENIDHSAIESVEIVGSANLSVCAIESICLAINNADSVNISGNQYGCNNVNQIESRCLSTSVSPIDESSRTIQVYPNPTQDELYINMEGLHDATFRIVDQMGKIVREGKVESELLASNLRSGLYFVSVTNINTISVQKVVVE